MIDTLDRFDAPAEVKEKIRFANAAETPEPPREP